MEKKKAIAIIKFVTSIGVCQFAGFVGAMFTTPSIPTWYAFIKKPIFSPPNWVFAPVWTVLFILMGIALFLVWRRDIKIPGVKYALIIFIIQLILNIAWSAAFFGLRSPLVGFVVIIILWIMIYVTIISFFKVSTIAGILLIPYILWVSFAAILNLVLFVLNPY